MPKILIETPICNDIQSIRRGFNLDLFKALKPPLIPMKVNRFDGMMTGDEVHLELGFPKTFLWVSKITGHHTDENEWSFIDEGIVLPFPLTYWKHHHIVRKTKKGSIIIDNIEFSTKNRALDLLIYPTLFLSFKARSPVYKKFFEV